jgi:hypothetical protein
MFEKFKNWRNKLIGYLITQFMINIQKKQFKKQIHQATDLTGKNYCFINIFAVFCNSARIL